MPHSGPDTQVAGRAATGAWRPGRAPAGGRWPSVARGQSGSGPTTVTHAPASRRTSQPGGTSEGASPSTRSRWRRGPCAPVRRPARSPRLPPLTGPRPRNPAAEPGRDAVGVHLRPACSQLLPGQHAADPDLEIGEFLEHRLELGARHPHPRRPGKAEPASNIGRCAGCEHGIDGPSEPRDVIGLEPRDPSEDNLRSGVCALGRRQARCPREQCRCDRDGRPVSRCRRWQVRASLPIGVGVSPPPARASISSRRRRA